MKCDKILEPIHPPECPWHYDWHKCNCGLFDTVIWNEPTSEKDFVIRFCSVEEAILRQLRKKGKIYLHQKEALDDFLLESRGWIA